MTKKDFMKALQKILYGISVVFDFIYKILLTYAKVVLLAIVFIVSAQVISRKFFGTSIQWSEEVAKLLMVWMAFISMAIGIQKGLHVAIHLFFNKFPKPMRTVLTKINELLVAVCGIVMIVYGMQLINSTKTSTLSATQWPASTLYLMIPVAGVFIAYFSLIEVFHLEKFIKTTLTLEDETQEALDKAAADAAKLKKGEATNA